MSSRSWALGVAVLWLVACGDPDPAVDDASVMNTTSSAGADGAFSVPPPAPRCEAPRVYVEPGCQPLGDVGLLQKPGCLAPCDSAAGGCSTGFSCQQVVVHPSGCSEDKSACDECAEARWLCLRASS